MYHVRNICLCLCLIGPLHAQTTRPDGPPTDKQINQLVQQLGSTEFDQREKATEQLWQLGAPAIPAIRQAVDSDDPEIRWRAKDLLQKLELGITPQTPKHLTALIKAYPTATEDRQMQIIHQLLRHPDVGLPIVIGLYDQTRTPRNRMRIDYMLRQYTPQAIEQWIMTDQQDRAMSLLAIAAEKGIRPMQVTYCQWLVLTGQADRKITELKTDIRADSPKTRLLAILLTMTGNMPQAAIISRTAGDPNLIRNIAAAAGDWQTLFDATAANASDQDARTLVPLLFAAQLAGRQGTFDETANVIKLLALDASDGQTPTTEILALASVGQWQAARQAGRHHPFLLASLAWDELLGRYDRILKIADGETNLSDDYKRQLQMQLLQFFHTMGAFEQVDAIARYFTETSDEKQYSGMLVLRVQALHQLAKTEQARKLILQINQTRAIDPAIVTGCIQALWPKHPYLAAAYDDYLKQTNPSYTLSDRLNAIAKLIDAPNLNPTNVLNHTLIPHLLKDAAGGDNPDAAMLAIRHLANPYGDLTAATGHLQQLIQMLELQTEDWDLKQILDPSPTDDDDQLPQEQRIKRYQTVGVLVNARFTLAMWLMRQRQYAKAAPIWRQLIQLSPSPSYLCRYAFCLDQTGHKVQARQWYTRAKLMAVGNADQIGRMIYTLFELGLQDQAQQLTRQATVEYLLRSESPPALGRLLVTVSENELRNNQSDQAETNLKQAIWLNLTSTPNPATYLPIRRRLQILKIRRLIANQQFDQIDQLVDQVLAVQPAPIEFTIQTVNMLTNAGQKPRADKLFNRVMEHFQQLFKQFPNAAGELNSAAWLCARTRRNLEQALQWSDRSLAIEPNTDAYLDTNAEILFQLGRQQQALELIRKTIAIDPDRVYYRKQLQRIQAGNRNIETPLEGF